MGDVERDEMAVVDSELTVRGLKGLRIADAGVFPTMPSINPMLTVLGIGERAAEMVAREAGWMGEGEVSVKAQGQASGTEKVEERARL